MLRVLVLIAVAAATVGCGRNGDRDKTAVPVEADTDVELDGNIGRVVQIRGRLAEVRAAVVPDGDNKWVRPTLRILWKWAMVECAFPYTPAAPPWLDMEAALSGRRVTVRGTLREYEPGKKVVLSDCEMVDAGRPSTGRSP